MTDAIVGREALGGPKNNLSRFSDGFSHCAEATARLRGFREVVYVGDQAYELDFARSLGARAVDVSSGVEDRPGHKDPVRIRRFLEVAATLGAST